MIDGIDMQAVDDALRKLEGAMAADGGGVTARKTKEGVVLTFVGTCRFCPSQPLTLAQAVIPAIRHLIPENMTIEIE